MGTASIKNSIVITLGERIRVFCKRVQKCNALQLVGPEEIFVHS
jgi:hypothetical protein